MANPNPARITDALWRTWTEAKTFIPGVRLGGIYANKPHYHSTVDDNQRKWPWSYSIKLRLDLASPQSKARAIDLTMSAAEMRKRTQRLLDAAERRDPRLRAVREFYGTTNGHRVVGRIKDSETGAWRWSTSDSSHLWHIHISIFTKFCDDWDALAGVISVLSGGTTSEGDDDVLGLSKGDSGNRVELLQIKLGYAGQDVTIDGDYGAKTAAAVLAMRRSVGSSATDGDEMTPYATAQLDKAIARAQGGGERGPKGDRGPAGPAGSFPQTVAIAVTGTATATGAE